MRGRTIAWVILMIALAGASGTAGWFLWQHYRADTQAEQPAAQSQETPLEVTAMQLQQAYNDNELAADQKYRGHPIRVTGQIEFIRKDKRGRPYVVLETELLAGVRCRFDDESGLANLHKGQSVTLRCTGDGRIETEPKLDRCVEERPVEDPAIVKMRAFRDEMCGCKNHQCGERVHERMNAWSAAHPGSHFTSPAALEIGTTYGECMARVLGGGTK